MLSTEQDPQVLMYVLGVWKSTGKFPYGVRYNIIRRPGQKIKKNEPLRDFISRVEEDIENRPDHYFKRHTIVIRKKDLVEWWNSWLNVVLEQVWMWYTHFNNSHNPYHYATPEALTTIYGKSEYFDYITRGSTLGLVKRNYEPRLQGK